MRKKFRNFARVQIFEFSSSQEIKKFAQKKYLLRKYFFLARFARGAKRRGARCARAERSDARCARRAARPSLIAMEIF